MGKTVIDIIIDFADSLGNKNISQILDDCIMTAENTNWAMINVNWFMELKVKIESELKDYAWRNILPEKFLLINNRVERMENGLKITNQTRDFTYLKIYFPGEFNPNSLIIERSDC